MPTLPTINVSTLFSLVFFFWILLERFDASVSMNDNVPEASCTTNDFDQKEAAKLKARLANQKTHGTKFKRVQSVSIADGAHKYVLIAAREPGRTELSHFVTSRRGARFHRNAAEPFVYKLEQSGYEDIEIVGGGRIYLDEDSRKISIFGFSYTFGQADHQRSKQVVLADERFKGFDVTVSNEGY